ncbi:casein kinase II subunit alpha [Trichoderma barbatum]
MSAHLQGYAKGDAYEVVRKIGFGKHADIFEGVRVLDLKRCIIKPAKEVGMLRIEQEIKILRSLTGGTNIPNVYDIVQDSQTEPPSLIFEYVDNTDFRSLYPTFRVEDVQYYMGELLKALAFCHSKSIMHRDIRPQNIMIDHNRRQLRLFGWDYAKVYVPNSRHSVRVGQGFIKAPELLLHYEQYDCSVDMWNVGAIIASMTFRKEPFFYGGASSLQRLQAIARVLGIKGLLNYVEKYEIETTPDEVDAIAHFEHRSWQSFFNEGNERFASTEVVDLLERLLRWDHKQRLTASEALKHAYFN